MCSAKAAAPRHTPNTRLHSSEYRHRLPDGVLRVAPLMRSDGDRRIKPELGNSSKCMVEFRHGQKSQFQLVQNQNLEVGYAP